MTQKNEKTFKVREKVWYYPSRSTHPDLKEEKVIQEVITRKAPATGEKLKFYRVNPKMPFYVSPSTLEKWVRR